VTQRDWELAGAIDQILQSQPETPFA
jgi:hypothetical protein